jgi:NADH-quinone oxidoreductase subunit H
MSTIETLLKVLFSALIYPGFLFIAIIGLLAEGVRRKFAAAAEGRGGPPLLQPLYDILKFFRRPTLVPSLPRSVAAEDETQTVNNTETWRTLLFFLPALAVLGIILAAALIPVPGSLWPVTAVNPLGWDLLAVGLLLELPAVASIMLGAMGNSIYSQVAASRVAQLTVVYLAPHAVAIFGPALLMQTLDMSKIAAGDSQAALAVKLVCALLYLVCLPARLRLRPLSASPGEGLEGLTTDLNGPPLAFFQLMGILERATAAVLFAVLLVPFGGSNPLVFIGGILLCYGVIGLVEVLFNQVRLSNALRFYFLYANTGALLWFLLLAFLVK